MSLEFEPGMVKALLSDPNETGYNVDFRERLGTAPVFDHIRSVQLEFSEWIVSEDDLVSAYNSAMPQIQEFDAEAKEQGLLGRVATLSGRSIEIPQFQADLSASVSQIHIPDTSVIDENIVERYYNADTATGVFAGFTLRFEKIGEKQFTPRIAYQVEIDTIDVPSAQIRLFATGIAEKTKLGFEDDQKLDAVAPLLERLYLLCGNEFHRVNRINMALSENEAHDAKTVRFVAKQAEKLVASVGEDGAFELEDALIELITHYIGEGDWMNIQSPALVLSATDDSPPEYHDGDEPYTLQGQSIGMAFFDRFQIKDDEVQTRPGRVLHIVLGYQKRNMCIPLPRIEEFRKV